MQHINGTPDQVDAPGRMDWLPHLFLLENALRREVHEKLLFIAMTGLFGVLVLVNILYWHQSNRLEGTAQQRVAILLPGSVEFFSAERAAMSEVAKSHGLDLLFFNAGWDSYQQIHQLEQVLSMHGIAAIALCAVDNEALMAVSSLMLNRDTPLITFTNGIGHDPHGKIRGVQAHVGRDEVKAGRMLGKAIEQLALHAPPKILLIQGAPGTPPQRFREEGFKEIMAKHSSWTIVQNITIPAWSTAKVEHEVQRALDMQSDFTVIATQWAGAAVAAANVLRNNHVGGVKIVTLEYTRDLQKVLMAGEAQSTSNFSVAEEGRRTIETVSRILNKEAVAEFIEVPQTFFPAEDARSIPPEW